MYHPFFLKDFRGLHTKILKKSRIQVPVLSALDYKINPDTDMCARKGIYRDCEGLIMG